MAVAYGKQVNAAVQRLFRLKTVNARTIIRELRAVFGDSLSDDVVRDVVARINKILSQIKTKK